MPIFQIWLTYPPPPPPQPGTVEHKVYCHQHKTNDFKDKINPQKSNFTVSTLKPPPPSYPSDTLLLCLWRIHASNRSGWDPNGIGFSLLEKWPRERERVSGCESGWGRVSWFLNTCQLHRENSGPPHNSPDTQPPSPTHTVVHTHTHTHTTLFHGPADTKSVSCCCSVPQLSALGSPGIMQLYTNKLCIQ